MPSATNSPRPTEAEARAALRQRLMELRADGTPLTDSEKGEIARRDPGCSSLGERFHDQRVLARIELGLPPHVEEDLTVLDPCCAHRQDDPVHEWTVRSRVEQGLPPHIEDPVVLDKIARMLLETPGRAGPTRP